MRVAVVGHVEWVDFLPVERLPRRGEIVRPRGAWADAAGGGGVAAVQLARLAGDCLFLTALGDDDHGHRAVAALEARGVRVAAAWRRGEPQRRAITFLEADGERTIAVLGDRHAPHGDDDLPWEELAGADAVYVTAGDAAAIRAARRAGVVVATPRTGDGLREAGVELDVLVHSERDAGETYTAGDLDPEPRWVVGTRGAQGGGYAGAEGRSGTWEAAPLPGPLVDSYGSGDTFAAGLAYGLGASLDLPAALALAARCGAACATGRGPYGAELPAAPGGGA